MAECITAAATTKLSRSAVTRLTSRVSGLDNAARGAALHGICTPGTVSRRRGEVVVFPRLDEAPTSANAA
ncbi:hypothetical protein GCM10009660_21830 [Catellatospora bangladeshensis]